MFLHPCVLQTVQYILPQHHAKLAQAELLVIDEAAAIPLTTVKSLLGPYLVFLCSTVNGYEGTGRSLSLKLIQQLREQGAKLASGGGSGAEAGGPGAAMRTFREVTLAEPIRWVSHSIWSRVADVLFIEFVCWQVYEAQM
jgi:N-acetyltransferase 10